MKDVFVVSLVYDILVARIFLKGIKKDYFFILKQRLMEIDNVERLEYTEIRRILWEKYFDASYSVEEIKTALKELEK